MDPIYLFLTCIFFRFGAQFTSEGLFPFDICFAPLATARPHLDVRTYFGSFGVHWDSGGQDCAHRVELNVRCNVRDGPGFVDQVVHNGTCVHAYQHRVLMTGTPMQNIKEELWPLMNFIDQTNFPDLQRFQDKYCKGEPGHEVEEVRARGPGG